MQTKRARLGDKIQMSCVLYAQHNANFGRPATAHRLDALNITRKGEGAKVVAIQELRRKLSIPGYETIQTDQSGHVGEALLIHDSIKILQAGVMDASPSNYGEAIGNRGIPWAKLRLPNDDVEWVFNYHRVPLRMQDGPLDNVMDGRLGARLRPLKAPWWVLGDMNQLIRADPADLRQKFGAQWIGGRIDLMALGNMQQGVVQWWEKPYPSRNDNHPTLFAANSRTHGLYEMRHGLVRVAR